MTQVEELAHVRVLALNQHCGGLNHGLFHQEIDGKLGFYGVFMRFYGGLTYDGFMRLYGGLTGFYGGFIWFYGGFTLW